MEESHEARTKRIVSSWPEWKREAGKISVISTEVFVKKRKVLITMDDDLYKRVEILAEKCHRSRPDQFRHLLLTHPDMEKPSMGGRPPRFP